MVSSSRYNKKATKIRLGDMDTVVDIYSRNLSAPKNVKFGLHLELKRKDVWCMWDVKDGGVEIFDNVNQQTNTATDIVRMHYDKDFREFDYIELNDNLYEVIKSDWLDVRTKEFIQLYCVLKGDKNKKVNIL